MAHILKIKITLTKFYIIDPVTGPNQLYWHLAQGQYSWPRTCDWTNTKSLDLLHNSIVT